MIPQYLPDSAKDEDRQHHRPVREGRGPGVCLRTADWSWLVEVSTASDMPARPHGRRLGRPPCSAPSPATSYRPQSRPWPRKWGRRPVGPRDGGPRVAVRDASPADAKVTVTSLGRSASDSWAGYDFAGGELARQQVIRHEPDRSDERLRLRLDGASASDPRSCS